MSAYALVGHDAARGQWIVCTTDGLDVAAAQLQWWQAQAVGSNRRYYVTDSEGREMSEQEIEAALERWRAERDARVAREMEAEA